MKAKNLLTICAMAAALMMSSGNLAAQDNQDGGGRRDRGPGGGGGGPGGGRGNFDPAQFQQRMMDNIREQLEFTKDEDWNAVEPLIQKVMDTRRDVGVPGGFGRLFGGGRNRGGDQGGQGGGRRGGGFFGQQSQEAEALQKLIDDNAPAAQIKDALAKYQKSQKEKQVKLEKAQEDLRAVLNVKQEAQATLLGLLN